MTTLAQAIQIYAGGQGSGCRGPNCGRPTTAGPLLEGDRVKIVRPVEGQRVNTWEKREFRAGEKGTVVQLLKKLPGQEQKVLVAFKGKVEGGAPVGVTQHYFVSRSALEIHKLAGRPWDPERIRTPVLPPRKIITHVKTEEGVKYTVVKPSREDLGPRGLVNYAKRPHTLKGEFGEGQKVNEYLTKQDYMGGRVPTISWVYEAKRSDGSGSVVWLMKTATTPQQVYIREENYLSDRSKYGTPRQFEYKNQAQAFKTLRDRYGIKMTMTDWTKASVRSWTKTKWPIRGSARRHPDNPEPGLGSRRLTDASWACGGTINAADFDFGGPGSGCRGENCGRPGSGAQDIVTIPHGLRPGTDIYKIFTKLQDGQWHTMDELKAMEMKSNLAYRIYILGRKGTGKGWGIETGPGSTIRMVLKTPSPPPGKEPLPPPGTRTGKTAEDWIRPWVGKTNWERYPIFRNAAQRLAGAIDPRFLRDSPPEVYVQQGSFRHYPNAIGLYSYYEGNRLGVLEAKGDRFGRNTVTESDGSTFLHELGHHWDYNFMGASFSARPAGMDMERAKDLRTLAMKEYRDEYDRMRKVIEGDRAARFAGIQPEAAYHVPTTAPRHYALTNEKEWIAESTAHYFKSNESKERLRQNTPNTYKFLDEMYTGKLFTEKRELVGAACGSIRMIA